MDLILDACFNVSSFYFEPGRHCPPIHDNILCWPATLANTTAYQYCSENMKSIAHRHCLSNGKWEGLTNYSSCLEDHIATTGDHHNGTADSAKLEEIRTAKIQLMIMFVGSLLSLVVLVITLVIFQRIKSLQCQRTRIHKHLIVSFILRFMVVVTLFEPLVFGHSLWYRSTEWLCRSLITLQQLSYLANFFWMLVEGLYLHLILVLRPFNNDKVPFLLFYIIGWVIPLLIAAAWAMVMHFEYDVHCWTGNTRLPHIFIIYAPIMLALFVNLLILVNLVRIIIVKLCTGHTTERRRICRTIKSTLVLVFLLGTINMVFFVTPSRNAVAVRIYRYVYAVLPHCQGIVVSVILCGMNGEVKRAIGKRWNQFKDTRIINSSTQRGQCSRTSVSMLISRPNQSNVGQPQLIEMQALKDSRTSEDTALT